MNKQLIIVIVIILVVAVGGFIVYSSNKSKQMTSNQEMMNNDQQSSMVPTASDSANPDSIGTTQGNVKEFTVTGSNFKFDPAQITVNLGDRVKITFKNSGGMHDLVIPELNANTKKINSGEQDVIEFTADKKGTFEYYCSVGNHRAMGMKGNLIVQ